MTFPEGVRLITSPTTVPDCALWWDAADAATMATDGSNGVSSWTDKVRSLALAQGTAGNRPLFNAANASLAGRSTVDFVGASNNKSLATAGTTMIAQPLTIIIAGKSDAAVYQNLFDYNGGGAGRIQVARRVSAERYTLFAGSPTFTVTGLTASRYVLAAIAEGARSLLYENGIVIGQGTTGAQGIDSVSIGALVDGAGSSIQGSIAEILVYARRLTAGELALIAAYLNRKWALYGARQISSPLDVANCTLWLDSSDVASITKDGSDIVSQWSDKSGLGNHCTQVNATNRPLYTASGIDFDGNDNYLAGPVVSTLITASDYTMFCVFVADAIDTTGGGATIYNNDGLITDAAAFIGMQLRTSSGQPQVLAYNWDANADSVTADISLGQRTLAIQMHGGGRLHLATERGVEAPAVSGNTTNITNVLSLGRDNGSHYFDGRLLEVIIFNRALSDGERFLVGRYLQRKYGF